MPLCQINNFSSFHHYTFQDPNRRKKAGAVAGPSLGEKVKKANERKAPKPKPEKPEKTEKPEKPERSERAERALAGDSSIGKLEMSIKVSTIKSFFESEL